MGNWSKRAINYYPWGLVTNKIGIKKLGGDPEMMDKNTIIYYPDTKFQYANKTNINMPVIHRKRISK